MSVGCAGDAYRGIPHLLDRCQVGPSANVLLVARAWGETGFVGAALPTAWGGRLHTAVDMGHWAGGVSMHTRR